MCVCVCVYASESQKRVTSQIYVTREKILNLCSNWFFFFSIKKNKINSVPCNTQWNNNSDNAINFHFWMRPFGISEMVQSRKQNEIYSHTFTHSKCNTLTTHFLPLTVYQFHFTQRMYDHLLYNLRAQCRRIVEIWDLLHTACSSCAIPRATQ